MDFDFLTTEAVEVLKRLVTTPRTSRNEGKAADIMQEYMTQCGMTPQRDGNNLWCVCPDYDESRPTLLLNAHIDTVPPSQGEHDPLTPTVEGDRLYGIGTNDDGASLLCLWQVFRLLCQSKQDYNVIYLASAEEEVSGKNGIEHALAMLPHIDVALVGEPTGMQPAVAEKGLMVLDCTAHGKAGHAARNEGVNAIYRAMEDIDWFRNYEFPQQTSLLGPVKMTVTVVNAGTKHNVVPAECTFTVDIRSNECYTNEEIYNKVCECVSCDVKARSFRLGSSSIPTDHPLVQRAIALGRTPFGSPTLSDQALMHWPSLKMGPGQSSRSHTADEYICISEMREAIEIYWEMLNMTPTPALPLGRE